MHYKNRVRIAVRPQSERNHQRERTREHNRSTLSTIESTQRLTLNRAIEISRNEQFVRIDFANVRHDDDDIYSIKSDFNASGPVRERDNFREVISWLPSRFPVHVSRCARCRNDPDDDFLCFFRILAVGRVTLNFSRTGEVSRD